MWTNEDKCKLFDAMEVFLVVALSFRVRLGTF